MTSICETKFGTAVAMLGETVFKLDACHHALRQGCPDPRRFGAHRTKHLMLSRIVFTGPEKFTK